MASLVSEIAQGGERRVGDGSFVKPSFLEISKQRRREMRKRQMGSASKKHVGRAAGKIKRRGLEQGKRKTGVVRVLGSDVSPLIWPKCNLRPGHQFLARFQTGFIAGQGWCAHGKVGSYQGSHQFASGATNDG